MYDLDAVAVFQCHTLVLGAWHDFFVSLDGDERLGEPEHGEQLFDRRARLDLFFFTIDHEAHGPRE
jgi:hypothetical protein